MRGLVRQRRQGDERRGRGHRDAEHGQAARSAPGPVASLDPAGGGRLHLDLVPVVGRQPDARGVAGHGLSQLIFDGHRASNFAAKAATPRCE